MNLWWRDKVDRVSLDNEEGELSVPARGAVINRCQAEPQVSDARSNTDHDMVEVSHDRLAQTNRDKADLNSMGSQFMVTDSSSQALASITEQRAGADIRPITDEASAPSECSSNVLETIEQTDKPTCGTSEVSSLDLDAANEKHKDTRAQKTG